MALTRSYVKVNSGKVAWLLDSPSGPVGEELYRRAKRTARMAREQAPVGEGENRGRLKRSIRAYRPQRRWFGQTLKISTSVPYAIFVHEGTRPHIIRPKNPGGALVFTPKGGTKVVVVRKVRHPGIRRPNRFLSDNVKYMYIPSR